MPTQPTTQSTLPANLVNILRALPPSQWREVGAIYWQQKRGLQAAAIAQASEADLAKADQAFAGFYPGLTANAQAIVEEIIGGAFEERAA